MIAAKIDTDELEVIKYFTAVAATNLTREDALAMVTDESVDDGVFFIGHQDGDFEDEDFEPEGGEGAKTREISCDLFFTTHFYVLCLCFNKAAPAVMCHHVCQHYVERAYIFRSDSFPER